MQRPPSQIIQTARGELEYAMRGQGPVVILCHGTGGHAAIECVFGKAWGNVDLRRTKQLGCVVYGWAGGRDFAYLFAALTVSRLASSRALISSTACRSVIPSTVAHSWQSTSFVTRKKPAIVPYKDLCSPKA